MGLKYLELSDETVANSLQVKTKDYTLLAAQYAMVDEPVVPVGAGFFVRVADEMDLSEAGGSLIAEHDKLPDDQALYDLKGVVDEETEAGFDLYKQLIADIKLNGGLNPSLDESIRLYVGATDVSTMVISLDNIRCMLKDHFVEFAFRSMSMFLDPTIGFTTEQLDKYKGWIREESLKGGTTEVILTALESAPKGAV